MRRIAVCIVTAVVTLLPFVIWAGMGTASAEVHKAFVCKYVGTPGPDERLQTGNNPIDVDFNAIGEDPVVQGSYFNDAQGRSFVLAIDTGQAEPDISECPGFVPETTTTTLPETTTTVEPTTTTTEPSTTTTVVEDTTTTSTLPTVTTTTQPETTTVPVTLPQCPNDTDCPLPTTTTTVVAEGTTVPAGKPTTSTVAAVVPLSGATSPPVTSVALDEARQAQLATLPRTGASDSLEWAAVGFLALFLGGVAYGISRDRKHNAETRARTIGKWGPNR